MGSAKPVNALNLRRKGVRLSGKEPRENFPKGDKESGFFSCTALRGVGSAKPVNALNLRRKGIRFLGKELRENFPKGDKESEFFVMPL